MASAADYSTACYAHLLSMAKGASAVSVNEQSGASLHWRQALIHDVLSHDKSNVSHVLFAVEQSRDRLANDSATR